MLAYDFSHSGAVALQQQNTYFNPKNLLYTIKKLLNSTDNCKH